MDLHGQRYALPPGPLRRAQHWLIAGACVGILLAGIGAGWTVAEAWRRAHRTAAADGDPERAPEVGPEAGDNPMAATATAPDPSATPTVPPPEWLTEDNLRRAAAALIRAGRPADAIRMLRKVPHGEADAARIAQSLLRRARDRLDRMGAEEADVIADERTRMTEAEWARCMEPLAIEQRRDLQALLAADSPPSLDDLVLALPDPMRLTFCANLQTDMRGDVECPPQIGHVLLQRLLPTGSDALGLLPRPGSVPRLPHLSSRALFATRFRTVRILPAMRRVLAQHRQSLLRHEKTSGAWQRSVLGAEFCGRLKAADPATCDEAVIDRLLEALPDAVRDGWLQQVRLEIEASRGTPLPEWLVRDLRWSPQGAAEAVREITRLAVRHPNWQAPLRQFRYAEALEALPGILQPLGFAHLDAQLTRELRSRINLERTAFESDDFDWNALRRRVGVKQTAPPGIRAVLKGGAGPSAVVFSRWVEVPPPTMHRGLAYLAVRARDARLQETYRTVADNFAVLRGLKPKEP